MLRIYRSIGPQNACYYQLLKLIIIIATNYGKTYMLAECPSVLGVLVTFVNCICCRKLEEAALNESDDDASAAEDDISVAEDDVSVADSDYETDEGPFAFRRREGVQYRAPLELPGGQGAEDDEERGTGGDRLEEAGNQDWSNQGPFLWTVVPKICASYCRYNLMTPLPR